MKITWKKIVVFIIGCGILKIYYEAFAANGVLEITSIFENNKALENVYFLSQIMTSVFVMLGTIIAIWQYILSSKESLENRKRECQLHEKEIFEMEKDRIQKAVDLSGFYKDNILQNFMFIKIVYQEVGVQEILNKINFQNIVHFDTHEMEDNISEADRKIIMNIPKEKKISDILVMLSEVIRIWDDCKEVDIIEKDGKTFKRLSVSQDAIIYKFQSILNEILNNLEFFAMHFTHGTADDSVVYQSLHQSYIDIVQLLYYDISANNAPGESKLYTNIIELYNKWVVEAKTRKDNEAALARENILKGKTLKSVDKN